MEQIKMGVVPSTLTQPKPAETKSAPKAKDKVDTGRTAKGSDDRYSAFNEDDMDTEVSPLVLVKVSFQNTYNLILILVI